MATPHSRSGGMVLDCQMAARTPCKPSTIGSPPAFSSSVRIPHTPAALLPFSIEITSQTSVRLGGSSLMSGSNTGIVTPVASKLTAGESKVSSISRETKFCLISGICQWTPELFQVF
ncbi:uncharacterized protein LOC119584193 [Penaeus monodon]|uniref:uncharacterized protein LOC119584193 n=1 Tax=Penaeus monodon TaxID=6687 RepID=UPI0018A77190|nr:uncharacterized protein LOC119584193 [Penaeus monodon]